MARRRRSRDPMALWSYQRMIAEANRRAGAVMSAERRAIQSERQRASKRNEAARLALQGAGNASAQMLQEAAGRAEVPFRDAATALGGVAGGYLEGLEQRQAQTVDPMNVVNEESQREVMRALGAAIPNEHLLTLGANARRAADQQPGIAATATTEKLAAALKAAGIEDEEYGQKLIDLAAKYPEVRAQIMDALQKFELEKRAQRLYEGKFGLEQDQFQFEKEKYRSDFQLKLEELRAEGLQVDASASRAVGYFVDQYGDPILDANGKKIKAQGYGAGGGKKGSQTAFQKAVVEAKDLRGKPIKDVDDIGEGMYLARPGAKGVFPDGTTNDPGKARHENDMSFAEAIDYLIGAYGLKRKQARKALIRAGWKPDGKRPKKTNSKRSGA